jgi:protein-tyrosine phosphatase
LTAAKGVDIGHPKQEIPYFLYVPAEDHDNFDISKYFTQAANYIHECLQKTNILVHCLAGVSRSVSLVIAYFIKYRQLTFDQAHHFIKSKRKIVSNS